MIAEVKEFVTFVYQELWDHLGRHFFLWPKKREKCFLMELQTDLF